MHLSDEEMSAILRENIALLENDSDAIALEFDLDDEGEVNGLRLVHANPLQKSAPPYVTMAVGGVAAALQITVVEGELPVEETAPLDVDVMHEEAVLTDNYGMSGTRVEEGGYWGTLCLSGRTIEIDHEQGRSGSEDGFLFSNSHVFHHKDGRVTADRGAAHLGTVTHVYNLDLSGKTTFDGGIARKTERVSAENAFKVIQPNAPPIEIAGLRRAERGMKVAKMGARTGWSEGRIKGPIITRVRGHNSLYPCWRATYRSKTGDSGSPILHQATDGKWYLVGIHFASGASCHSWDNADVTVA